MVVHLLLNFFEDVIDRDLQLIPLVCHDDLLHEDNNKVAEQSLIIIVRNSSKNRERISTREGKYYED